MGKCDLVKSKEVANKIKNIRPTRISTSSYPLMYPTRLLLFVNLYKTGEVYSLLEYTQVFFANSKLLIKDYLDNLSYKLYKLLGLKSLF
jgi:hypothetical protein